MNYCAASWILILIGVVIVEGVSLLTASQKSSWWTCKLINIHVTKFLVRRSLSPKWLYPPLCTLVSVTDANASRRYPSKQRDKPQNHILGPGLEGFFFWPSWDEIWTESENIEAQQARWEHYSLLIHLRVDAVFSFWRLHWLLCRLWVGVCECRYMPQGVPTPLWTSVRRW